MTSKRVRSDKFYCGCGAAYILPELFIDRNPILSVECKNCGAKYQFTELRRYVVTPIKEAK